jgi:hypothetical protein
MAKANSKSTKSLKSKTTRRAAKPKRKPIACPVEALGRENDRLALEIWAINHRNTVATNIEKQRAIAALEDKMRSNRHAATFLHPRSKLGAVFLLVSAYADLNAVAGSNTGHPDFRRGERALYEVLDWFYCQEKVKTGVVAGNYYMPHPSPQANLRAVIATS